MKISSLYKIILTTFLQGFFLMGCTGIIEHRPPPPDTWEPGPPPHAPAHGYRRKYTYRYYPDAHVYFDVDRNLYFFLERGKWKSRMALPSSIRIKASEWVTIDLDTPKPYLKIKEHEKRYPPGKIKIKKPRPKKPRPDRPRPEKPRPDRPRPEKRRPHRKPEKKPKKF